MQTTRSRRQLAIIWCLCSCLVVGQNAIRIDDSNVYSLSNPTGIQYSPGEWSPVSLGDASLRYQGTYTRSKNGAGMVFLAFRGTSIAYYADKDLNSGNVTISIDGGPFKNVSWTNAGTNVEYQQQMWFSGPLNWGDHQVTLNNLDMSNKSIGLDFFEVTPAAGSTSITPQGFGPGASSVPANAVIVDDGSNSIGYSGNAWDYWDSGPSDDLQGFYFNNTEHWAKTPGAQCSLTFNGTAVWYFADDFPGNAWVTQKLFWSTSNLSPEPHTITLTHVGVQDDYLALDFFMYLPSSASPSTPRASDISSKSVPVAAIAGGAAGGVALVAILIGLFVFFRKRRSRQAGRAEREPQHETYPGYAAYHTKEFNHMQADYPGRGPVLSYRSDSPYTQPGVQTGAHSISPTTWTGATAYTGRPEPQ